MKLLISGGAGFIGSHLCDYFINHKQQVICVDNFITGQRQNIKHLLKHPKFKLIQQDITHSIRIKEKIDKVLHFASPASPSDYMQYPLETLKANAFGTYHLLELAIKNKAIFFLASTSEVYGDPQVHPQPEKYFGNVNPIGLRAVYDEAKRFAEAMVMTYHRQFNLDIRIARIFNTYGPRMRYDDGRIIPTFIYQTLHNKPVTIFGDGKQTRSFCYISDMIDGIVKLLNSKINEPINLGNPEEISVLQLAKKIKKVVQSSVDHRLKTTIRFIPSQPDDPHRRKPDISLAKKYLSWSPKIKLEDGLKLTIINEGKLL